MSEATIEPAQQPTDRSSAGDGAPEPPAPPRHERTRERVMASLLNCPDANSSGRAHGLGQPRSK